MSHTTRNQHHISGIRSQRIGSRFVKATPSFAYSPREKAPSRRDLHRMEVAQRKAKS